jgi:hypothetical protein
MTSQRTLKIKFAILRGFVLFITVLGLLSVVAGLPSDGTSPVTPQHPRHSSSAGPAEAIPGAGVLSFQPPVTYPVPGEYSASATVADVNGDGIPDIIVISLYGSPNGDGLVSVLLGNGDGTFQPATSFDSGGDSPEGLAVGDVNNDGKLDIVVANCSSTNGGLDCPSSSDGVLAVLLGNGDGTFQSPITMSTGVLGVTQMALADVNLDGNLDAIVATNDGPSPLLFLGNGNGTFQPPSTPFGCFCGLPTVADVNGDGIPDLLMTSLGGSRHGAVVDVFLGNGDGTFQPAVGYSDILGPDRFSEIRGMTVSNVNGSGELDVLAVGGSTDVRARFGVLLGNGDGTFAPKSSVGYLEYFGESLAVADFNGDGIPDLAVGVCSQKFCARGGEGLVFVFPGTSDGKFEFASIFDVGALDAGSTIAADLNGDGKPDLVVAHFWSNGVTVLLNDTVFSDSPTSTSLSSSQNPSSFGQKLTFTATVSSASGPPPDGEKVTFFNGSAVLGEGSLAGGVASLTTTHPLSLGTHLIAASYRSDANLMASTSPVIKQVVTTFQTTLSSAPNPSTYGEAVTFTAVVTPAPPDGETVSFMKEKGKTVLGTGTLSGGTAIFVTSALPVGATSVTAVYGGDSGFKGSKSKPVKQVVEE